jgi:hypothetical protein
MPTKELDVGTAAIGKRIREQDNRATDAPMFIVQQVKRIYGLSVDYAEYFEWMDADGDVAEGELEEKLESRKASPKERKGWKRVGYVEIWEFVTACFTREACEDYIACNGHNLKSPRIYADGSYRNKEFRAVRDFLIGCSKAG